MVYCYTFNKNFTKCYYFGAKYRILEILPFLKRLFNAILNSRYLDQKNIPKYYSYKYLTDEIVSQDLFISI